jgi:hypothetical protein
MAAATRSTSSLSFVIHKISHGCTKTQLKTETSGTKQANQRTFKISESLIKTKYGFSDFKAIFQLDFMNWKLEIKLDREDENSV